MLPPHILDHILKQRKSSSTRLYYPPWSQPHAMLLRSHPAWMAGQMIGNLVQYVSPSYLTRRDGIIPRVFAPRGNSHSYQRTRKASSECSQPIISLPCDSKFEMGILRRERLLQGICLSLTLSWVYYLTLADRDLGAWGSLF